MQFDINIEKTVGAVKRTIWGRPSGRVFALNTRLACDVRNLVLAGPSGSGKSLTLQAVAGLLQPDTGKISVGGRVFFDSSLGINIPARERRVGYVFQDYALFPHRTVRENISFSLKRWGGALSLEHRSAVNEVMDVFGIRQLEDARPSEISGGQRQRTALARAIVARPDVLLLDEPFSALDQPLRLKMREELARILNHYSIPMILVTHDIEEAEFFAETVAVYADGGVHDILSAVELAEAGQSISSTVGMVMRSAYGPL